jgi:hypothetical protein
VVRLKPDATIDVAGSQDAVGAIRVHTPIVGSAFRRT